MSPSGVPSSRLSPLARAWFVKTVLPRAGTKRSVSSRVTEAPTSTRSPGTSSRSSVSVAPSKSGLAVSAEMGGGPAGFSSVMVGPAVTAYSPGASGVSVTKVPNSVLSSSVTWTSRSVKSPRASMRSSKVTLKLPSPTGVGPAATRLATPICGRQAGPVRSLTSGTGSSGISSPVKSTVFAPRSMASSRSTGWLALGPEGASKPAQTRPSGVRASCRLRPPGGGVSLVKRALAVAAAGS